MLAQCCSGRKCISNQQTLRREGAVLAVLPMPPEIVILQLIGAVDSLMTPDSDSDMPEFWIVSSLKGEALKPLLTAPVFLALFSLSACATSSTSNSAAGPTSDACGASRYQKLVGGPSSATAGLKIPADSRHYGSEERVATDTPTRLNFVHSGTAVQSVTDPKSKVIRVFCG